MTAPLLHGVAVNPAAPTDVLLRLLTSRHKEAWSPLCRRRRDFPDAVVDAIVTHPEPRVRADFVRNPYVDGEVRGRLVDDPDWIVLGGCSPCSTTRNWLGTVRRIPGFRSP
ncbi:hypothetical protein [Streptomyces sp. NPDC055709]